MYMSAQRTVVSDAFGAGITDFSELPEISAGK